METLREWKSSREFSILEYTSGELIEFVVELM